jgi:hypothetical protein
MRTIQHWIVGSAITSRWPDNDYQEHHRTQMRFPTAT